MRPQDKENSESGKVQGTPLRRTEEGVAWQAEKQREAARLASDVSKQSFPEAVVVLRLRDVVVEMEP